MTSPGKELPPTSPPSVPVQDDDEVKSPPNILSCEYCCGPIVKRIAFTTRFCTKSCAEMIKMVPVETTPDGKKIFEISFGKRERGWSYYKEILRERAASSFNFAQITEPVKNLETGMKLEALDMMNPVNYCVATVTKVVGHRLCIRYDGFGDDSSFDQWFNFQADELFPIGWCSKNGFSLQPPTGISSTSVEWKAFLSKTLTGALAAPSNLFKPTERRRQLRCYSYMTGDKVEAIHPKRPDLICPAVVTKSLGPYYYLVTTDALPNLPPFTLYSYADAPGVYPSGWCESKGLVLDLSDTEDIKMVQLSSDSHRKVRVNPFKVMQKIEALDNEQIGVGTITEIFGRVALLIFDHSKKKKFFDKNATDIYPIGWCERTENTLVTPYGEVNFKQEKGELMSKRISSNNYSGSFKQFIHPSVEQCPRKEVSNKDDVNFIGVKSPPVISTTQSTSITATVTVSITATTAVSMTATTTVSTTTPTNTTVVNSNHQTMPVGDDQVDDDIDLDIPLSPKSPVSHEKAKNEMENFVIWLLNHYEFDPSEAVYVVKQDLVEAFTSTNNVKILPRWFALLYKLFPGAATVRRCHEGKFLNCLRNLKERTYPNQTSSMFVSDVADYLKECKIQFLMDSSKVVILVPIGDNALVPIDTSEIFMQSKGKRGSNIFTISCDIDEANFTVKNFTFHYEDFVSSPPLEKITTMADFRAVIQICIKSRLCKGVEVVPKPDNTLPNFRQGKVVRNGRLFSSNCNTLAYVHKGNTCIYCKSVRYYQRNTPTSKDAESSLNSEGIDSPHKDGEEGSHLKEEEMLTDLQFYFNKSCFIGHLLDSVKVSKMWEQIPRDRPAQALKYLIERLIEVSNNKDKFLEMLEDAFGARLFNREKQKVVKKGLFRFNTRRKVLKFLNRLNKRLQCCDFFMRMDRSNCNGSCKGRQLMKNPYPLSPSTPNHHFHMQNNHQSHSQSLKSVAKPNSLVKQPGYNSNNMQLVYQLPSSKPTNSPQFVVQTPPGQQITHFGQGAQFLVPQSGNNVTTYMVVTKESAMSNLHVPINGSPHIVQQNPISSLTSGVTQMISNVSKTNLMSDIDDPSVKKQPSSIAIVKSGLIPSNQQLVIKKNEPGNMSSYISPANKSPLYRERNSQVHMPKFQYISNEVMTHPNHDNMRPVVQAANKHQQKHVHKTHHGNARVKYVEFKPMQNESNPIHMKPAFYPVNKVQLAPTTNSDLIIHTPGGANQTLMQQSPPALKPPPAMPPRSIALTSPPSLVASPELRPRFNFSPNAASVALPHYRGSPNQMQKGDYDKNRVTFTFGVPQQQNVNKQMESYRHGEELYAQGSSMPNSSSVSMTMTYIPIQTQTKDKLVYVPVNSLQPSQNGQQILFYPQNQQLKDTNGKPILLSPQVMQQNKKVISSPRNEHENHSMTTVRIQDGSHINRPINPHNPISVKQIKSEPPYNEYSQGFSKITFEPKKPKLLPKEQSDIASEKTLVKSEHSTESVALRNNEAIPIKFEETGMKRKLSPNSSSQKSKPPIVKVKKRRGRPPSSSKSPSLKNNVNKNEGISESPSAIAKHLLSTTFNKSWSNKLLSGKLLEDPLSECIHLPQNPEEWTPGDVETFMSYTDCAQYGSILRSEEIDGKAFLMLTREALMEFIGMRLGPALKISGHAAFLRAKQRALYIENKNIEKISGESQLNEIHTPYQIKRKTEKENAALVNGYLPIIKSSEVESISNLHNESVNCLTPVNVNNEKLHDTTELLNNLHKDNSHKNDIEMEVVPHAEKLIIPIEKPIETFAAPVEKFTSPIETFASPVETFASPVETFASPVEKFASPVKKFASPVETIASPVEKLVSPVEHVSSVEKLASPPVETFVEPVEKIVSPIVNNLENLSSAVKADV